MIVYARQLCVMWVSHLGFVCVQICGSEYGLQVCTCLWFVGPLCALIWPFFDDSAYM